MNDEDGATLSVGFTIDTEGSVEELARLQKVMDSTEAKILGDAKSIERATAGMLNLEGGTAKLSTFGAAATREMESARRATNNAEKAGESLIKQLERQIQTYGKTASEIRNMRAEQRALAAEAQGLTELAARVRATNAEMVMLESGTGKVNASMGRNRAAMAGASYQLQDFMTQVSMGANPLNAFAVQGGQLAGQFSMIEGKAGNVARFFMGPWGLAITAGLMVLGPLVSKIMEGNNALDDAVDKLKKDARETEATREAKERFKTTAEGVAAAIRDGTEATQQSINKLKDAAEQANIDARVNLAREIQIRKTTMALLDQAKAEAAIANGTAFGAAGGAGAGAAQSIYAGRALAFEGLVKEQGDLIIEAERRVNVTRVDLAMDAAKRMNDPVERIKKQWNDQIKAAQQAAYAHAQAGGVIDNALTRQIAVLERNRDAAVKAEEDKQKALKETANQIGRNISLAEGRGIAQSIGGTVTSDHRDSATQAALYKKYMDYKSGNGPWAALAAKPGTSMHELDQAVDVAKKDGVTLKKLIAAYRAAGVKVVEALDEGSHFHIAWGKVGSAAKEQTAAATAAAREIREAKQAAKKQVDDAVSFASNLEDETDKIGKTAIEIKRIEVAAAAAAAPIGVMRDRIYEAGSAWETATAMKEIGVESLLGDLKDLTTNDLGLGNVLDPEFLLGRQNELIDKMREVADSARLVGDALAEAFGRGGQALGGLIDNFANYAEKQAELRKVMDSGDTKKAAEAERQLALLKVKTTGQAISGIKNMFNEHSKAYKVMQAVEKAYAVFQAVQSVASIARTLTETTVEVGAAATKTAANTAAGASKIFSQLGWLAFPVVGAMIALLASLGGKGGGGGSAPSIPSAEDIQDRTGTGTVLGDSKAKSDSIARSLEIVASNTNKDLEYSNQMLKALHSIDTSIAKLAGTVAQQITVSGSLFDTSKLNLGTSGSGGFLGLFSSSTTKTLWDAGLNFAATTVADVLNGSISGTSYQTVQKIKKKSGFLGIGGGTKTSYQTTTGAIDSNITAAVADVITSLRNGLVAGADVIGLSGAQAILDAFQVNLGTISLKDMTGEEIEAQFQAVFSKLGDQMATALLPSLSSMQLVGEGLFETFMRVAREYEVVDIALKTIGKTFGAVGLASIAARDNLVQLFGSLDEFVEQTSFFADQFMSDAERIAPIQAAVTAELARLGMAGIKTRDQFKQAVLGLDLTTQAGRDMYASLLAVAPGFDKVLDYFDQANKAMESSLKSTADQFRGFVTSLTKFRESLFGAGSASATYQQLRSKFNATATLAGTGDATALGGLEAAGKAFLDSAKNNASSLVDYQRDVALVAQGVDKGIFAADAVADYAQLQLDALNNATSILGNINTNTAATATALGAAPTLVAPSGDSNYRLVEQNDTIIRQNALVVESLTKLERYWSRIDGDGLIVRTDADSPLNTVSA